MFPRTYDQTEFGIDGNCVQACIATLLGARSLDDVPNFVWTDETKTTHRGSFDFWEAIDEYLESIGLVRMMHAANYSPECYYLVSGKTSRETSHMVIMKDNKLVHDPHPSRDGLEQKQIVHVILPVNLSTYKGVNHETS